MGKMKVFNFKFIEQLNLSLFFIHQLFKSPTLARDLKVVFY